MSPLRLKISPLSTIDAASGTSAAIVRMLGGNLFVQALNIGTGILTARQLGPDGRGELAALILWPQFLAFCLTLGLPSSLIYNARRDPERAQALTRVGIFLALAVGTLAALVGVVGIPFWLRGHPTEIVRLAQLFVCSAPVPMLGALLGAALQASGRFTFLAVFRALSPALTLAALAAFAFSGRLTPFTAALAFVVPPIPVHLWLAFQLLRGNARTSRSDWVLRPLLRYGLGAYGTDLIATLSTQLDRVLVVAVLSPEAAGLYAVGISFARLLEVASAAAVTVVFPKACERPADEIVELVGRVARCAALIALLMAIAVAALAPIGLRILYGSAFLPVLAFLPILLLDAVLGSVVLVLTQAFLASGRPFVVTLAQGVGAGASLLLFVILVPRHGLMGASIALLLATTLRFAFVLLSFGFVLRSPAPGLVPTRNDLRALARMFLRPRPATAT